jgi:hypothetical protein
MFLQKSRANGRGLRQKELCDRLSLNYRVVALSAKQLGLSTHEYLQQDTGWVLHEERYYPPQIKLHEDYCDAYPNPS